MKHVLMSAVSIEPAQLDAHSTGDQEVMSSRLRSGNILIVEIDHEIFSTIILSLPLIQEGKLSVTCKRMCTEYWLTALQV